MANKTLLLTATAGMMSLLAASPVSAISFTATGTGPITAYFHGQTAGYGSVIGMNVNGVSTGIFGLQNHASAYGDSLVLGNVVAGDSITFVMLASTAFNGPLPLSYTWYSDPTLNSDGFEHVVSSSFAGDAFIPAGTYVGFEDLPGLGDQDFDDHQFVFTGVRNSTPDGGSTLALLGGALTLLGTASRRFRQ